MIDKKLQEKFFDEYGTPMHVRRHCSAVAECAVKIGKALNEVGYKLDLELIEGAANVHDVARTAADHEKVGAEFLVERGYEREARLVRGHMRHAFNPVDQIDELDVLCMADRVVKEDEYVGIDERMAYLMQKPGMTPERIQRIKMIAEETREYFEELEKLIGKTFDELLG